MKTEGTYICLKGIRFHAMIGVMEQEQKVGNDIIVDLRIRYPFCKAMNTDEVDDTLNYAAVYDILEDEMRRPKKLLEAAAGSIVRRLLSVFTKIESIDLTMMKVNPPMRGSMDGAAVEIHLINDKTEC